MTKHSYISKTASYVMSLCFKTEVQPIPQTKKIVSMQKKSKLTTESFNNCIIRSNLSISSGPAVSTYIRHYHNDWETPDFTEYRKKSVSSPECLSSESSDERRLITYSIAALQGLAFMYGAKSHLIHYISFMNVSAEVLALARIEINLLDIPEGKSMTFKWRGKPLFVKHRTAQQIEIEQKVDISKLRDPQTDDERVKDPKWLVVIGVCTHLGCVPIADAGDYNGYYCPCHGSHFDGSGRTRKGPAPTNLEIPDYTFNEDTLIVG